MNWYDVDCLHRNLFGSSNWYVWTLWLWQYHTNLCRSLSASIKLLIKSMIFFSSLSLRYSKGVTIRNVLEDIFNVLLSAIFYMRKQIFRTDVRRLAFLTSILVSADENKTTKSKLKEEKKIDPKNRSNKREEESYVPMAEQQQQWKLLFKFVHSCEENRVTIYRIVVAHIFVGSKIFKLSGLLCLIFFFIASSSLFNLDSLWKRKLLFGSWYGR